MQKSGLSHDAAHFVFRNFVKWSEKDGINRLDHKSYLEAFKESFYHSVIELIDKAVHKERQLIQDDLYIEVSNSVNSYLWHLNLYLSLILRKPVFGVSDQV